MIKIICETEDFIIRQTASESLHFELQQIGTALIYNNL